MLAYSLLLYLSLQDFAPISFGTVIGGYKVDANSVQVYRPSPASTIDTELKSERYGKKRRAKATKND